MQEEVCTPAAPSPSDYLATVLSPGAFAAEIEDGEDLQGIFIDRGRWWVVLWYHATHRFSTPRTLGRCCTTIATTFSARSCAATAYTPPSRGPVLLSMEGPRVHPRPGCAASCASWGCPPPTHRSPRFGSNAPGTIVVPAAAYNDCRIHTGSCTRWTLHRVLVNCSLGAQPRTAMMMVLGLRGAPTQPLGDGVHVLGLRLRWGCRFEMVRAVSPAPRGVLMSYTPVSSHSAGSGGLFFSWCSWGRVGKKSPTTGLVVGYFIDGQPVEDCHYTCTGLQM